MKTITNTTEMINYLTEELTADISGSEYGISEERKEANPDLELIEIFENSIKENKANLKDLKAGKLNSDLVRKLKRYMKFGLVAFK